MNTIASKMFNINAITLSFNKYYTWSSGFKSPIYSDHRMIISDIKFRKFILNKFIDFIAKEYKDKNIDMIAGVATAGIPHASWVSMELDLPMLYVRPSQKKHGKENHIEGFLNGGENILVIEDVFTTGSSSLKAIKALKEKGANILGVIGILDYNFLELAENFNSVNVKYHAFYDFKSIINNAIQYNHFSSNEIKHLQEWIIKSKKFNLSYLNDTLEAMKIFDDTFIHTLLIKKYQEIIDSHNKLKNNILSPIKVNENQLKALVKELILVIWKLYPKRKNIKINIHSQGFIRFIVTDSNEWKEGKGLRLHIWHKNISKPFKNVFNKQHRHSFLSESIVLLGTEITDNLYNTKLAHMQDTGAVKTYKTPPGKFVPDQIVTLHHTQTRIAKKGWTLHYPKDLYHLHNDVSGFVVTLFQKHNLNQVDSDSWTTGPIIMPEIEDPRLIVPDQDEMWHHIFFAIQELSKDYNLLDSFEIQNILESISDIYNVNKFKYNK
ncbi:MAG TPA: orotate phosphoribosyltransferase [Bacteroidia bacterium]|nr:orotate phosphoribosyltransferase [Bacteroidia bacterium]